MSFDQINLLCPHCKRPTRVMVDSEAALQCSYEQHGVPVLVAVAVVGKVFACASCGAPLQIRAMALPSVVSLQAVAAPAPR